MSVNSASCRALRGGCLSFKLLFAHPPCSNNRKEGEQKFSACGLWALPPAVPSLQTSHPSVLLLKRAPLNPYSCSQPWLFWTHIMNIRTPILTCQVWVLPWPDMFRLGTLSPSRNISPSACWMHTYPLHLSLYKSLLQSKCLVSKRNENTKQMASTHLTAVLYNETKSPWDLWVELFPLVFQRSKSATSSNPCAGLLKGSTTGLCCSCEPCAHPKRQHCSEVLTPIAPGCAVPWLGPKSWGLWSLLSHCLYLQ